MSNELNVNIEVCGVSDDLYSIYPMVARAKDSCIQIDDLKIIS